VHSDRHELGADVAAERVYVAISRGSADQLAVPGEKSRADEPLLANGEWYGPGGVRYKGQHDRRGFYRWTSGEERSHSGTLQGCRRRIEIVSDCTRQRTRAIRSSIRRQGRLRSSQTRER